MKRIAPHLVVLRNFERRLTRLLTITNHLSKKWKGEAGWEKSYSVHLSRTLDVNDAAALLRGMRLNDTHRYEIATRLRILQPKHRRICVRFTSRTGQPARWILDPGWFSQLIKSVEKP